MSGGHHRAIRVLRTTGTSENRASGSEVSCASNGGGTMKIRYVLALMLVPVLVSAQQAVNRHLQSKLAAEQHLPFSSGVVAGNTLYIAGTIGVEPGAKVALSAEEEARRVMDQVKQVVQQAGMTMDDVVSVQVFCTDLANYDTFNKVY